MAKLYKILRKTGWLLSLLIVSTVATAQLIPGSYMTGKSLPRQGNLIRADMEVWLPADIRDMQVQSRAGNMLLTWQTGWERGLRQFEIEYSEDNITWRSAGIITALNDPHGGQYRFSHTVINADRIFYRLKLISQNGTALYTAPVSRYITGNARNSIPTLISNHTISLFLSEPFETVILTDMSGKVLRKQRISGRTGRTDIQLPIAANGACIVSLYHIDPKRNIAQKILVK